MNSSVKKLAEFIIDPSWDVKTGQSSGKEMCKQSNPHLMIIFDGLMLFAQFWLSPQGREIKLTFLDLRPWIAARSCNYKSFTAVSECTTIIPPGIHLEQKALGFLNDQMIRIIKEFLSPWRESGTDRKQRFCVTSPETNFSVIAQINQPTASISDVTLSYTSNSLIFPGPIHFFCLLLHHSMRTTMFLIHLIGKIRDHA